MQFDDGKVFYNVDVETLLGGHGIEYFFTDREKKASVVERFNRTLKTAMWKYSYSKRTYNWMDVLVDPVYNYNNTKHGTTLKKPKDVNEWNENGVHKRLRG